MLFNYGFVIGSKSFTRSFGNESGNVPMGRARGTGIKCRGSWTGQNIGGLVKVKP